MAATDILSLAEARDYLAGLRGTAQDDKVANLVRTVSRRIDAACGAMVERAVTELHDGGRSRIRFRAGPAASITSASELIAGVATTVASTEYRLVLDNWELMRLVGAYTASWSWRAVTSADVDQAVTVVFVAGRFVDTASVDQDVKSAAGIYLQHLWRPAEGGGSQTYGGGGVAESSVVPTFDMPYVVSGMLSDYLRVPVIA